MISLSNQKMKQLSELAQLSLSVSENRQMEKELNKIIDWLNALKKIKTEGTNPLFTMSSEENRMEEDQPLPPLSVIDALRNAPQKDSHYFHIIHLVNDKIKRKL